jgi:hypothetical protein
VVGEDDDPVSSIIITVPGSDEVHLILDPT